MKTKFTKFIILAVCLSATFSCKKSNPYDIPVNYYLAANNAGDIVVYKDTAKIFTYNSFFSYVTDIAMSNGKIELCGYVADDTKSHPAIWVDGVMTKPLKDSIGCFEGLFVDGKDRYYLANIEGKKANYGALVKNDSIVYASKDGVIFDKFGVGASGDFYIAGRVKNSTGLFNKAYMWRINSADFSAVGDPIEIMSSDTDLSINAIQVGLHNIAVAIEKHETSTTTSAYGWLYDNRAHTESQQYKLAGPNSKSTAAMFAYGYWWIGGARPNGESYDATIFRNGNYAIPMEAECNPGGSCVALLYFGGYNKYECVHSPGQIQLCRNGALRHMISCPVTLIPAAWLVVRQ